MKAFDIKIFGHVRGIGFDYNMRKAAEELGVTGWVKGSSDDSIICHIEGDDKQLEKLQNWLEGDYEIAEIREIDVNESKVRGFTHFEELVNN